MTDQRARRMKRGLRCEALFHAARHASLLISLLIPVAQIHAQTQATMNAKARAEFVQADAELNKTYQAVLAKLSPDARSDFSR